MTFHSRARTCGAFFLLIVCVSSSVARAQAGLNEVSFNEIMYHPADEGLTSGEEFEFIELKNTGTGVVDLSGVHFGEGIQYVFPAGTSLAAGALLVLASVPSQFEVRYGFAPFGAYDGQLNNGGEQVSLVTPQGAALLEVEYDDDAPWPVAADGSGFSLVPVDPSGSPNPNDAANWRLSRALGGSPGADDPAAAPAPSVVVNELLAHTDPPQQDAVELHNVASGSANIGGWYLSDDAGEPHKYRIASGTTIPPGGYLVLDEEDFGVGANGFGFSEAGEDVLLFAADDAGTLTGVVHGFRFAASENQVSFGRHVNSQGEEHFVRQRALTFGQSNAGPRPSPVVISEIMYRPGDDRSEFIELVNVTDGVVPLYDPARPENPWRIDGIGYDLPTGTELAPGEVLLVAPALAEVFRAQYGLPETARIIGPYTGALSNAGERIVLQQPGPPDDEGAVPFISMDIIDYRDDPPWPAQADGDGPSLERIDLTAYGNDPINWRASGDVGGSPGDAVITAVEPPDPSLTGTPEILSIYPNPLRTEGHIAFRARAAEKVRVVVYDLLGRAVRVLHDGKAMTGAPQEVAFDARGLPGGIYVVRAEGPAGRHARQVVVVR